MLCHVITLASSTESILTMQSIIAGRGGSSVLLQCLLIFFSRAWFLSLSMDRSSVKDVASTTLFWDMCTLLSFVWWTLMWNQWIIWSSPWLMLHYVVSWVNGLWIWICDLKWHQTSFVWSFLTIWVWSKSKSPSVSSYKKICSVLFQMYWNKANLQAKSCSVLVMTQTGEAGQGED